MMAGEHYRLRRDPKSSHQQIARLLKELRPAAILDVGAAQGILGQLLADSGTTIDAIEPNSDWAEAAKPYYRRVMNSTVEAADLPDNTYDCVVCADVLEHLPDLVPSLQQTYELLRPGGRVVLVYPNPDSLGGRWMGAYSPIIETRCDSNSPPRVPRVIFGTMPRISPFCTMTMA